MGDATRGACQPTARRRLAALRGWRRRRLAVLAGLLVAALLGVVAGVTLGALPPTSRDGVATPAGSGSASPIPSSGPSTTAPAACPGVPPEPPAAAASSSPPPVSPGARIAAYFVVPAAILCGNVALLASMQADAITFGYRVVPTSASSYPPAVQRLVGGRAAYGYTGSVEWSPAALRPADRTVTVAGVTWTVMDTGRGTVVVSQGGTDRLRALNAAGNRLSARTIVGLPAPRAGSQGGVAYLPDTTYLAALAEFTTRFVLDQRAEGADGFYQHVEMPVSETGTWASVRSLYAAQNAAVSGVWPGALVILSPYLESRTAKAGLSPEEAARGARLLVETARGTRLLLAPQDGLGVGTTALSEDRATGRVAPLEAYLRAMRAAVGTRLWANIELMRPGPDGSRLPTTQARVAQQLTAEAPYVSGFIAFPWDDSSRGIGATRVPGGVTLWSAGFGRTLLTGG